MKKWGVALGLALLLGGATQADAARFESVYVHVGMSNTEAEKRINDTLTNIFRQRGPAMAKNLERFADSPYNKNGELDYFFADMRVTENGPKYLGLVERYWVHRLQTETGYVFSKKTGRPVTLSEITGRDRATLNREMKAFVMNYLENRGSARAVYPHMLDDYFASHRDLNYTLSRNGEVILIFSQGALGSPVMGLVHITVPRSVLPVNNGWGDN